MRYGSDHKAETRARVLREAGREIRAKGPSNVAVAGIMRRAGLTHGGFYSHFLSKDALVVDAIDAMFADAIDVSRTIEAGSDARSTLRGYIDVYLSVRHRDARDRGCPLPALSGDLPRASSAARERFAAGVTRITRRIADVVEALNYDQPHDHASAILAQMVGAVVLARAVPGAASEAILRQARWSLITQYGLEDET